MQRRPEGAGDLVGNSTQPRGMKLALVRDTAVLAEVALPPPVRAVMRPVHGTPPSCCGFQRRRRDRTLPIRSAKRRRRPAT